MQLFRPFTKGEIIMSWMSVLARDFNDAKWWKYYQKAHRSKSRFFKKWYTFKYMRMASKNGGYVGRETVIKGKPELPHGFHGIHISRRATIGKNVTILQNVTIGNKNAQGAVIGDGVFIGANAVIIGNVSIGNGAKIGAGAIVVEDVAENCTAVGPKARIIQSKDQVEEK
jgi:serine O-acetyltransferase